MCENLLECFNSCVPQNIDKLVRFFFLFCLNCSLSVPYCGSNRDHLANFMPHWRLLTVVIWQRKATDLRCEQCDIEVFE